MFNTLVDPKNITNFSRNKAEKELFALFCICCAGKNSTIQAGKLAKFLGDEVKYGRFTPFKQVNLWLSMGELRLRMENVKLGQYSRLFRSFAEISGVDIDFLTLENFESIYGVGPKTSRLFFLHTYKDQKYAVIDTHVLKFLRKIGYKNAPKNTPSNNYSKWENIFLDFCADKGIVNIAEFDLFLWSGYANKKA